MNIRRVLLGFIVVILVQVLMPVSAIALDTRDIDKIRNKAVLESRDLQVIDDFLASGVREIIRTRDFTSVAKIRADILSRRSNQGQYAQQFSESALKHISDGLGQTQRLPDDLRFKITLNLLILIDGMQDPGLVDLAIGLLKNENKTVRYWAVKSVTNPGLYATVGSSGVAASPLVIKISDKLGELIGSSNPEILSLIAEFAAKLRIPQGQQLLLQIVGVRIDQYASWTVEYELLDGFLLEKLCDRLSSAESSLPEVARLFAQLYSYVIQRYVKGQEVLNENSKGRLLSVMISTEDGCLSKLLRETQSGIRRAVGTAQLSGLMREHDRLLGSGAQAGILCSKLGFNYGSDETGIQRTAPQILGNPPQEDKIEQ